LNCGGFANNSLNNKRELKIKYKMLKTIASFADKDTRDFFHRKRGNSF
jgi:hypothetical protein